MDKMTVFVCFLENDTILSHYPGIDFRSSAENKMEKQQSVGNQYSTSCIEYLFPFVITPSQQINSSIQPLAPPNQG